jgi:hypothetical protein
MSLVGVEQYGTILGDHADPVVTFENQDATKPLKGTKLTVPKTARSDDFPLKTTEPVSDTLNTSDATRFSTPQTAASACGRRRRLQPGNAGMRFDQVTDVFDGTKEHIDCA